MNFDPQKFFIGLMDFFSILLPVAPLTWLRVGRFPLRELSRRPRSLALPGSPAPPFGRIIRLCLYVAKLLSKNRH